MRFQLKQEEKVYRRIDNKIEQIGQEQSEQQLIEHGEILASATYKLIYSTI
jgi:hypothetical protein